MISASFLKSDSTLILSYALYPLTITVYAIVLRIPRITKTASNSTNDNPCSFLRRCFIDYISFHFAFYFFIYLFNSNDNINKFQIFFICILTYFNFYFVHIVINEKFI